MFIIPFCHKVTYEKNINIHCIQLLTIGGTTLWEEDEHLDMDRDILESNDIYRKGDTIQLPGNVVLCEIDIEKTNVQDFYKWSDLSVEDHTTFCWKTYYYLLGEKKECWLHTPCQEIIGNYSVESILQSIIERKV